MESIIGWWFFLSCVLLVVKGLCSAFPCYEDFEADQSVIEFEKELKEKREKKKHFIGQGR